MIYLSGAKNKILADHLAEGGGIGLLNTPGTRYKLDNVGIWAMDNGCFTGKYPGDEAYVALLNRLQPYAAACKFVAVPDAPYDADGTLELFNGPIRDQIAAMGYPVALVLQNGMENMQLPWDRIDAVFVGGDTEWKLSDAAYSLMLEAKRLGKWVHVGRVNSAKRYRHFAPIADSADGTFLAFGPEKNLPQLLSWIRQGGQTTITDAIVTSTQGASA